MLNTLVEQIVYIHAKGLEKDVTTGLVRVKDDKDSQTFNNMQNILPLSVGDRVMLIRNIDLSDCLVNGVMGTVTGSIENKSKAHKIQSVLVNFDDPKVGANKRKLSKLNFKGSTPIEREQVFCCVGKSSSIEKTKSQFPLNLSFACTSHKTQRIVVDVIVVSFDGAYRPGQAYVALNFLLK